MLTEWENDLVRLVDLQGFRKASHWPWNSRHTARFHEVPGREVRLIAVHHSMGGFHEGLEAVESLAAFHTAAPRLSPEGKVLGGGKGWPGLGYTFVVPAIPAVEGGKIVVYRIWPDSMRTWHTGGLSNSHGVAICVGGHYASAAEPLAGKAARARPDQAALVGLGALVDYLAARYRLQLRQGVLVAHREVASTLCPGDHLADWVREKRGELVAAPRGAEDRRPLDTPLAIQGALVELGYDPGQVDGLWGARTKRALRLFQGAEGLAADGLWGPQTERAVRAALARR